MNLQFFLSAAAQTELFRQSGVKARPVTSWAPSELEVLEKSAWCWVTPGTEMTRRPAQDTSYIKQLARWWPGWRDESEFV